LTVIGRTRRDAFQYGIGIAHQDLSKSLIERHTIAENILSLSSGFFFSQKKVEASVVDALKKYELGYINPRTPVWKLSGGEKQRVEILKALITNPRVLILDEPTSMLNPPEVERLFNLLKSQRSEGKSIVIITHHLEEAIRLSDRITVLRNGQVVRTLSEGEVEDLRTSHGEGIRHLANLMVGRDVLYDLNRESLESGKIALQIENLVAMNDMGAEVVKGISFEVRESHIFGIAGNGQRELIEAIVHWRDVESGSVRIHGKDMTNRSIKEIRDLGVSYMPENRIKSLIPDLSVRENLMLSYYTESEGPFLDHESLLNMTDDLIRKFAIETPSPLTPVRSLSGGNKQKVVVARELSRRPPKGLGLLVIAENPTFGLDVATTQFVREELLRIRSSGAAILLVSSDLTEILTLSDEIAVIYKGELMGTRQADTTSREEIGIMMGGAILEKDELQEVSP
jgi:ABC-type uncharacterized transport system ATPase subunit